jgi:DNA-directed RNA polymerase subunit omega
VVAVSHRPYNAGSENQGVIMLEELKEEEIVNKVGGRFKLSTLIQKRMVALNRGSKPLVEVNTKNPMEIVVQEILNDKIYLDLTGNVQERTSADTVRDAGPTLDDL